MELRQLRYFVTVAEELHFGRAAARLHMSQPPLSAQVQKLEHTLGVRLLERSTRRTTLTPAGELFLRRAREILAAADAAADEAREADAGRRGRLRVGFVGSANFTVLPPAIRAFRQDRPGVEVRLEALTSGEQVEALHAGTLDVGLIRLPALGTGLHLETLLTEELVAVVPDNHPLAARDGVGVEDLVGQPLVLFPYQPMPGFVGQVLEMFAEVEATPQIVQQAIHHETILSLVAADIGLSILPASATSAPALGVRFLPIESSPLSELAIATRPDLDSPMVSFFVDCLRRAAALR
ncbi:LysR family transcriptional regulator [Blastococcus sp. SYSU D00695]